MKGTIINFNSERNIGIIRAEDGKRYRFSSEYWKETTSYPTKGMLVDFEIGEDKIGAEEIYALPELKNSDVLKIVKNGSFKSKLYIVLGIILVGTTLISSTFSFLIYSRTKLVDLDNQSDVNKTNEEIEMSPTIFEEVISNDEDRILKQLSDQATVESVENIIRQSSNNPSAVQFNEVRKYPNGVVCGQANMPNEYGGYAGFQNFAFLSVFNNDMTGVVIPNADYEYAVKMLYSIDLSSDILIPYQPENYEILCVDSEDNVYNYFRPICDKFEGEMNQLTKTKEEFIANKNTYYGDEDKYQNRLKFMEETTKTMEKYKNETCSLAFIFGQKLDGISSELEWAKSVPEYNNLLNFQQVNNEEVDNKNRNLSRLKLQERGKELEESIEQKNLELNKQLKQFGL